MSHFRIIYCRYSFQSFLSYLSLHNRYTPNAINEFCDLVSVTRRGNENIISIKLLEHCIRKDLDRNAPRTMAVIDPIKITFTNLLNDYERNITVYPFPKDINREGPYQIFLTKTVFVERTDIM